MADFERYYAAIRFLEGLSNLPTDKQYLKDRDDQSFYLKRTQYFLDLIKYTDKTVKYIHITGTAGKGTVTTMVHETLHAAGKKVGSFTSPFTITSIEKIKVGERYIAPLELASIVEYLKPYINEAFAHGPYGAPSYFELFFVIALLYFKKQQCEWVVLEVGLGGRYDATNVIKKPVITAITTIDYDHTEVLGNTLEKIARDKGGIIKKNSYFITSEQRPSIVKIFKDICKTEGASFLQVESQENYAEYNKALATAIANTAGIAGRYIARGIQRARLPARFEVMQKSPLVVLDGAHNRVKVMSTIDALSKQKYKKLYLIIGMADSKNKDAMLSQIVPLADYICFTRFQQTVRTCADPKVLLVQSKKYLKKGAGTALFLNSADALADARKKAKKEDLVLVVGSFYLAGELRTQWIPEKHILRHRKSFYVIKKPERDAPASGHCSYCSILFSTSR